MDIEKIDKLREFAEWAREYTGCAVNVTASIWRHDKNDVEQISYGMWVDGIISHHDKNIDDLVDLIPTYKELCRITMRMKA